LLVSWFDFYVFCGTIEYKYMVVAVIYFVPFRFFYKLQIENSY